MTRMLEMLDIHDWMRVLEIGTGTGYNLAWLCHRLGQGCVFSVDIDPHLLTLARHRLAGLGYHPTLATADGTAGLPEHAPYDRILATCAVPRVPRAWCEQTREGGLVLVDVKIHAVVGNLVLLRRHGDQLTGRFDNGTATFMQIRTPTFSYTRTPEPQRDRSHAQHRTTSLAVQRPWEHSILWFLLHLTMPGRIEFGYDRDPDTGGIGPMFLYGRDGSWCQVATTDDGTRHVWEGGPRPLWRTLEQLHDLWTQTGQPGWERFGMTVHPQLHTIWLDSPDSKQHWVL
jgi:protein-L-isoaspartate O-methyltransferase